MNSFSVVLSAAYITKLCNFYGCSLKIKFIVFTLEQRDLLQPEQREDSRAKARVSAVSTKGLHNSSKKPQEPWRGQKEGGGCGKSRWRDTSFPSHTTLSLTRVVQFASH